MTDCPVPRLVAHRGDAARFPENSLEAIAAALDAGAWHVEFDVQLTADGVPVLSHDADLQRCCGLPLSLLDSDYDTLRGISAGEPARFGGRFASLRLATLQQAMERVVATLSASAFVEIKAESLARFGVARVMERVLEVLAPFAGRYTVISFRRAALEQARTRPTVAVGWVLAGYDEAVRRAAQALQPEFLFCNHRHLPADDTPLWPGPWQWVLYEVGEPALALSLAARGASLIETFKVAEMLTDPLLRMQARPTAQA